VSWFTLQLLSETFLILRRDERDAFIRRINLHVNYPAFLSGFNETLNFLDRFSKKYPNAKFHENLSSGSRVLPCRQTEDEQTNITKLIVASCNLANTPQRVSSTRCRANWDTFCVQCAVYVRLTFPRDSWRFKAHLCTSRRSIKKIIYILPTQFAFTHFIWFSEQTTNISLGNVNSFVSVTETKCFCCAVRTEFLNLIHVNISL